MVSFGAVSACLFDSNGGVERLDLDDESNAFKAELKPISKQWDPEALAISGHSREHFEQYGREPIEVMSEFADWIRAQQVKHNATGVVFAAYPLGFDWMFTYWYLVNFSATGSPFGHSKHIDMKSYYAAKAGKIIGHSVKGRMPKTLLSKRKHTHDPLDDAREQGELHSNLLEWVGSR